MKTTEQKKGSFLGGVKNFFIETEEETQTAKTSEREVQKVEVSTATASIPSMPETSSYVTKAPEQGVIVNQVDEINKMRAALETSFCSSTSSAFDYPKYRTALGSLKAVVPDEVLRFKSAFITAQTLKISKADVINSAKECIATLDHEKQKFEEEIKLATTNKISVLEADLVEIDEAVAFKLEAIKKLNEEVSALNLKKHEVQANIFNSKKAIEASSMYFSAAHNGLKTEIQSDIEKMSTYLEG